MNSPTDFGFSWTMLWWPRGSPGALIVARARQTPELDGGMSVVAKSLPGKKAVADGCGWCPVAVAKPRDASEQYTVSYEVESGVSLGSLHLILVYCARGPADGSPRNLIGIATTSVGSNGLLSRCAVRAGRVRPGVAVFGERSRHVLGAVIWVGCFRVTVA